MKYVFLIGIVCFNTLALCSKTEIHHQEALSIQRQPFEEEWGEPSLALLEEALIEEALVEKQAEGKFVHWPETSAEFCTLVGIQLNAHK